MRQGFILIEWMVQCMLCTLLATVTFALFRSWSTSLHTLHKTLGASLPIPIACDVLRRDVLSAPPEAIHVLPERCTIKGDGKLVSWLIKDGALVRKQKLYDTKEKRWRRSIKNMAVEQIGAAHFCALQAQGAGTVTGVQLVGDHGRRLCLIALRSGKRL